jgi:gluconokinase
MIVVVMGVSGSGKTAIGSALAARLGWTFFDGDDFHPAENIAKMHAGIPLTDADRDLWLAHLRDLLERIAARNGDAVLACSALRREFREALLRVASGLRIVHLRGEYALIEGRLRARRGHFMPPELLRSQFDALEEPDDALTIDVSGTPADVVDHILIGLGLQ